MKTTTKKASKSVKNPQKPAKHKAVATAQPFLFHWVHDISVEVGGPARSFATGERHLDLLVSANHSTMPHNGHVRLELRLRANIHTEDTLLAVAEIKYVGVVKTIHPETTVPELLAELYPFARQSLQATLELIGHKAPLPDTLEVNKIKS